MFKEWRKNLLAGFLTILPLAITIAIIAWFFKGIDKFSVGIINFLPSAWLENTAVRMFWKIVALIIVIMGITFIGVITRNVLGKKMLGYAEKLIIKIPFVNKIYNIIKEMRDTLIGGKKELHRVVLVEYPRKGIYSIGFVVNPTAPHEIGEKVNEHLLTVLIPTAPNPTSGFIIFVPEKDTIPLNISVEKTMRFIVSCGTINI